MPTRDSNPLTLKTWGFRAIDRLAAYSQAVADIDRSCTIAADPQQVWDVLADFGSISSWADNVDHSCILNHGSDSVGTTRRVQIGRDALVERIIEFDPTWALAYEVEGLPKRLRRFTNRWTLRAAQGGTTVVTLTSTVEIGTGPIQKIVERAVCRVQARRSDVLLAGLAKRLEKSRV